MTSVEILTEPMNTQNKLKIDENLEPVDFGYDEFVSQNENILNLNTDTFNYTKIDCLDEDEPINGQTFVLMSFVSPEGIMNCNIRGLKIRGVYPTESQARAACDKLKQKDKYFDVFVGEVGKWLPWNPSTKQIKEIKYRNNKLEKIMGKLHENELKTLNEVVGRKKDLLDKETVKHRNRIKQSIKEGAENYKDPEEIPDAPKVTKKDNKEQKKHTGQKNPDEVRARLKKMLDDRNKEKTNDEVVDRKKFETNEKVNNGKKALSEEAKRINENKEKVVELTEKSKEIASVVEQMKKALASKKTKETSSE